MMQELYKPELSNYNEELNRAFDILLHIQKNSLTPNTISRATSVLQRKLQCGYNRAAKLMTDMEERFWISAPNEIGERKLIRKDI